MSSDVQPPLPERPVTIPNRIKAGWRKLGHWRRRVWSDIRPSEPVFQTFELPLAAFAELTRGFDPARVRTISLRFDRTPMRVLILSQIGFGMSK